MRLVRELQGGPLTLEKYHRFFVDPWDTFITIDHLNLIIYMHGFNRLYRVAKKEIMGHLVGQVDLQPPRRSTLQAGAPAAPTAAALITTDEAVADVDAIGWEECPIGCVAAFAVAARGAPEPVEPTPRPADFVVTGRGKRSKRRRSSAYGGCKRRGYAMKEEADEEEEADDEDDDEWLPPPSLPPSQPPVWMRSPTPPPPSPPPLWMRSPTPPPPPASPPQTMAPPRPPPSPLQTVAPPPPRPPPSYQQEVAPHPPPFMGQQPTLVQQLSWGLPLPVGPLPPPAWPQGPAFTQHLPPAGPTPYWSSPTVPLSHPAPFWGAPSVLPPAHMFWGRPPPPPPHWGYHTSPSAPAMQQPPPPPAVQLQQWSPPLPGVGWGRPVF